MFNTKQATKVACTVKSLTNVLFVRLFTEGGGHRVLSPFGDSIAAPSSGIQQHPLTDRKWYVPPSVSVGFGRDFAVKRRTWRGVPLILMGKIGITSLLPYKKIGHIIPTAELSIGYRFQSLTIAAQQVRRD